MSQEEKFVRRSGLTVREVEEDLYLLDLDGHMLHRLSGVGVFIWELLEQERSVADLVVSIVDEYDVDAETAEKDCRAFLADLEKQNLVFRQAVEGSR